MDDRTARLVNVLALTPLTAVLFAIFAIESNGGPLESETQSATIGCTVILTAALALLWRRYVRWTRGRTGVTFALAAALITHAALWIPIWKVDCVDKDILCLGQSMSLCGVWATLLCLLWWIGAWTATRPNHRQHESSCGRHEMTPNTVRMALSFALIPFLPGFMIVVAYTYRQLVPLGSGEDGFTVGYLASAAVAITAWILIWRRRVNWTPRRRKLTIALAGALAISCLSPQLPVTPPSFWALNTDLWELLRGIAPLFLLAVWLGGTAWLWRESVAASSEIPFDTVDELSRCPKCTYSLKGLGVIRCPECGWTDTVDGVIARSLGAGIEA